MATLSRARLATRVQFLVLGGLAGAWGAHVPSVRARYGLGDGMLSVVLLAAAIGAVLSLFVAGRIVGRLGARQAAAAAAVVFCTCLSTVLAHGGLASLLPSMVLLGASMSLFDVAINTEGSELESVGGRPVMSGLHAMFSVGGMGGAALAAAMIQAGIAPGRQLAGLCAAAALVALAASRGMLETHATSGGTADEVAHFAWPRGRLLVLGALVFAGMLSEGVMYDWSVLYLKQDLGLAQSRAALGYACFSAAMAGSRFAGDALRARLPEAVLLRSGATLAAFAMAAVLVAADPDLAFVGFALAGAGLAPVAPVLFNAATRVPGVSRAAAIASVTAVGYSGFIVGPPLVGGLASAVSLSAALWVVVVAAVVLAAGAGAVRAAGAGAVRAGRSGAVRAGGEGR